MKNAPLHHLHTALERYIEQSGRRVSLEYLLLKDLNDDEAHLAALKEFCRGLLCHVNILPFNEVAGSPFQPASAKTRTKWVNQMETAGIETTVRDSRGSDIEGACGQLKNALR